MGALVVSTREQLRIHTVAKVALGKMKFKEAMVILSISERTLRRWVRRYEKEGLAFIRHKNSGKKPKNKKSEEFKAQIIKYVEAELYDFNMLHALEKITEKFNVKVARETFRRWCHQTGLVKQAHHKRRGRARYKRNRFSQEGFMLQLDGSPERWFGDTVSCMVAAIDDATSKVMGAEFFKTESTFACFKVLLDIFTKYGLPSVIYVDRAGMYGGQKRTNFSQLVRALDELNVQIIYANSPEGKGRIERLFKTLQDRLIPELRLAEITTYEGANEYLREKYLPHMHNPRFAVQAENMQAAWRPIPLNQKLEDVFCIKEKRRIAKDHTFSYEGEKYLITTDLKYSIYNHDIEIRIDQNANMRAIFAGRDLTYVRITLKKKAA
jgi:transposase